VGFLGSSDFSAFGAEFSVNPGVIRKDLPCETKMVGLRESRTGYPMLKHLRLTKSNFWK